MKSLTPCSWLSIAAVFYWTVSRTGAQFQLPHLLPDVGWRDICSCFQHLASLSIPQRTFVHLYLSHSPVYQAPSALFTGSRESPADGFYPGPKQPAPESHLNRSACQSNFPSAQKPGFAAPVVSPGGHQWDLRISSTSDHAGPEPAPSCSHPADGAAGMPQLCGRPLRLGIPGVCLQNRTLL